MFIEPQRDSKNTLKDLDNSTKKGQQHTEKNKDKAQNNNTQDLTGKN